MGGFATLGTCSSSLAPVCLLRKKFELFVLDPAGDWYYRWLFVVAMPVLYNWCLLVAR